MHRQGRIPQNYNSSEPIYERVRGKTSSFPRSRSCLVTQVEEGGERYVTRQKRLNSGRSLHLWRVYGIYKVDSATAVKVTNNFSAPCASLRSFFWVIFVCEEC